MSSKNFNKSFDYIEANKDKLSEIDYWFYLSVNHRYLEKYQEALSLLTNVIKIDSAYGRAYQEYGHNYIKLDNADMALKSYVTAVKYNPSLQASWLGILTLDNADEDLKALGFANAAELGAALADGKTSLSKLKPLKPWFALAPPVHGFKRSTKKLYGQKGILGSNKELDTIVRRMI